MDSSKDTPRRLPRSPGRRASDGALPHTWNAETAEEVAGRLRDHHERLEAVERLCDALADDVHGIREAFEGALRRWTTHIEADAKRRAAEADQAKERADTAATTRVRTNLMWAAFILAIGAAVTTSTGWYVKRQLEAYAARDRSARLVAIETAMERLPSGAAYRLDDGRPRVAALEALLPADVRGLRRDEVIAICVQRPELCRP